MNGWWCTVIVVNKSKEGKRKEREAPSSRGLGKWESGLACNLGIYHAVWTKTLLPPPSPPQQQQHAISLNHITSHHITLK